MPPQFELQSFIHRPTREDQIVSFAKGTTIGVMDGHLKFHNGTEVVTISDNGAGGAFAEGLNVVDYGAVGDGVTNDHDAIQECINDAIATKRRRVYFPSTAHFYKTQTPILVHGDLLPRLSGEATTIGDYNQTGSTVNNLGCWGPCFHIRASTAPPALPTSASLVTGAGVSLHWTADDNVFIDLSDAGASSIFQGLSQFSVQFFAKFENYVFDFQTPILQSSGGPINSVSTSAFYLKLDTTGHLYGAINVGGSLTEISSTGTLAVDTVYQFEINYDGTSVKMFYGLPGQTSVQAGSTVTVSGTVSHTIFETLSIGGERINWPHGDLVRPAPRGNIDSIRISNVSRHMSTYTVPTVKYTSDANTLILENFDNETSDFSIIYTLDGPAWLQKHGGSAEQGQGLEIDHLGIASFGPSISMYGVINSYIHDCSTLSGTYGIIGASDMFLNRFERLGIGGGRSYSRVGIVMNGPSGINTYNDIDYSGWPVAFTSNSGGGVITSNYFHGGNCIYHAIVSSGSYTFESCSFSNEDATAGIFVSDVLINGSFSCVLMNCGMEHFSSSGAKALRVNAGHSITLVGCQFFPHASATECIEVVNAPDQPVMIINPAKTFGGALVPLIPFSLSGWVTTIPSSINVKPVRASGFGTSSVFTGGTDAFTINVGTGGIATSGVITMPPAVNGWMCTVNNLTARLGNRTDVTYQIAGTTTSITIENQDVTGAALAWTASDILHIHAEKY